MTCQVRGQTKKSLYQHHSEFMGLEELEVQELQEEQHQGSTFVLNCFNLKLFHVQGIQHLLNLMQANLKFRRTLHKEPFWKLACLSNGKPYLNSFIDFTHCSIMCSSCWKANRTVHDPSLLEKRNRQKNQLGLPEPFSPAHSAAVSKVYLREMGKPITSYKLTWRSGSLSPFYSHNGPTTCSVSL